MRIELPHPAWADTAQRAHEDAHTLTVPPAPLSLAERWFPWEPQARALRIEVPREPGDTTTLTF